MTVSATSTSSQPTEAAERRSAGPRGYTRGALAFPHLFSSRGLVRATPLSDSPARTREDPGDLRRSLPIVPLMSLNVPVPIRYRRVEASSGSITSSAAIPSVASTSNSTNVDLSAFSHGPEYRCACTLYADVRKLIVASFRWSRTDGLPVLLNKAERHFPTLNTLLRSNVVAAVIDAREAERTTRPSRNQTMEQHHQEFLNDFEEWMREN